MDILLKLRELRRMRGLTQKEAAQSSGVGEKTLSSFETGERIDSLKVSQLLQLLAVYDVTPVEFFGDAIARWLAGEADTFDPSEGKLVGGWRALPYKVRQMLLPRILHLIEDTTPRLRTVL